MKKQTKKYYFSVEGETEKWYFAWLQKSVNAIEESKYNVKFDVQIQQNPVARVKGMMILGKTEVVHVFDRESENPSHMARFERTLRRMREAEKLGKTVKYTLGYSNVTFELWMILHKTECNGPKNSSTEYLPVLNKAYGENFENLREYKHENHFKRILNTLTLQDVIAAVQRSKAIMQRNEENGFVLQQHGRYKFYRENPSLSLWEVVYKILKECGIL